MGAVSLKRRLVSHLALNGFSNVTQEFVVIDVSFLRPRTQFSIKCGVRGIRSCFSGTAKNE